MVYAYIGVETWAKETLLCETKVNLPLYLLDKTNYLTYILF